MRRRRARSPPAKLLGVAADEAAANGRFGSRRAYVIVPIIGGLVDISLARHVKSPGGK